MITPRPSKAAKLRGNRLEVEAQSADPYHIRGRVRGWYRAKARDYFAHRLDYLSSKLSWVTSVPQFRMLEMTRQWGSCSAAGQIILNPHLVKAPRQCVDYVLIHEMAHLIRHHHGPRFFRLLDREIPDWKRHKQVLDGMVEVMMNE